MSRKKIKVWNWVCHLRIAWIIWKSQRWLRSRQWFVSLSAVLQLAVFQFRAFFHVFSFHVFFILFHAVIDSKLNSRFFRVALTCKPWQLKQIRWITPWLKFVLTLLDYAHVERVLNWFNPKKKRKMQYNNLKTPINHSKVSDNEHVGFVTVLFGKAFSWCLIFTVIVFWLVAPLIWGSSMFLQVDEVCDLHVTAVPWSQVPVKCVHRCPHCHIRSSQFLFQWKLQGCCR